MKKINLFPTSIWSTILVISVFFSVFILPVMPVEWHRWLFRVAYSIIYVSAIFSLEKRSNNLLTLFVVNFSIEWISGILNLDLLNDISRSVDVVFFTVIIIMLIKEIATSRNVTPRVILDSITGYLLLGLIYSIFVTLIIKNIPDSYSNIQVDQVNNAMQVNVSAPLYYSFVTIASLGYGDICPIKPLSRSLATIITVSGQFYMATIVALLVGKFSSKS
jgi:hypothetical protein